MAVLARASAADVGAALEGAGARPEYTLLKSPESGAIMVEGRAGGGGRRFNLGEATMTRCVVALASGTLGFCYALGRDALKAERAALVDALLQEGDATLLASVDAIAARQAAARDEASRKAAATKVDFFTLVRAEG